MTDLSSYFAASPGPQSLTGPTGPVSRNQGPAIVPATAAKSAPALYDPWAEYVVPSFPLDCLPVPFADFARTAGRQTGACTSALAMGALAAASGALDHRLRLRLMEHGHWMASPRLWVLLVAGPSGKKTPAINAALAPLEAHENSLRDEHERAAADHEANPAMYPEPAKPPRFVVTDTTTEKLGELLSRQDRGVLVKRDEFSGFIGALERYTTKNGTADRAFYLQAYDGGRFTVDRLGRGETRIRNLSVSFVGGIQPARLAEMHGLSSDGLLQRFLPVMLGPTSFPEDAPYEVEVARYWSAIQSLVRAEPALGGDGIIQHLRFEPAGLLVSNDLRRYLFDIEQTAGGISAGFQAFVGKLAGVFGSLALILHMADDPESGPARPVTFETAGKAARIVRDFLLPHALEFYRTAESETDGDRIQKIASFVLTSRKARLVASDFTANVACLRGRGLWDLNQQLSPLVACG